MLCLCQELRLKLQKMELNVQQPLQMKSVDSVSAEEEARPPLAEHCLNLPLAPSLSLTETQYSGSKFGKPSSLRVCMFQLTESGDPERVAFILDSLAGVSEERLDKLAAKYGLQESLLRVLQKYCDGGFGFEGEVVRSGLLQLGAMSVLVRLSRTRTGFQELLDATPALELVTQLMEEAIIFVYEDAVTGGTGGASKCVGFLQNGLAWFELALHLHFARWFEQLTAHLKTLERRLRRLTDEDFELAKTLTAKFSGLRREEGGGEELQLVSPGLAQLLGRVQAVQAKFEALAELNENFGEKYARLFLTV